MRRAAALFAAKSVLFGCDILLCCSSCQTLALTPLSAPRSPPLQGPVAHDQRSAGSHLALAQRRRQRGGGSLPADGAGGGSVTFSSPWLAPTLSAAVRCLPARHCPLPPRCSRTAPHFVFSTSQPLYNEFCQFDDPPNPKFNEPSAQERPLLSFHDRGLAAGALSPRLASTSNFVLHTHPAHFVGVVPRGSMLPTLGTLSIAARLSAADSERALGRRCRSPLARTLQCPESSRQVAQHCL